MRDIFLRIIFIFSLTLAITTNSWAQQDQLLKADSLFGGQKYTEAFELYDSIFNNGQASPAMLVKMSFIQEGLGNYSRALYYLNLYYNQTADKAAAHKMREIAEEHQLAGYEYSDMKFLHGVMTQYQQEILLGLLAFSLFLLVYAFRKRMKQEWPAISLGVQVFTLIAIGIIANHIFEQKNAIVRQDNSLLMTGPSAGAEPVSTIGKGNKVEILKSDELWTEIIWNEEQVYIRTKNLMIL